DESRSGAEKKALNVHFLTSSQKLKNGSGYFLLKDSVPRFTPHYRKRCAPRRFLVRDITDRSVAFNHDHVAKASMGCHRLPMLHK
ncbi:hypothetical protein, partial [Mesorhizobium sp. A623]